ncbi:aspartate--ammonia ligase [Anaeromicrobium sediminis]|uniref:Aspartate--ammonia ligase n=1 Tax=Anaeromicrobium sediminis TaxID=1478221 RepID=A0A267MD38_9FIRM|nr:aspartate--ammonia ligase [Anaeromicrobium sediminis]PAB56720.1 aspartate--ammonia ligase [Anaeromicrobium sediminis]
MYKLFVPEEYTPVLDVIETEVAIKKVKDFFERALAEELNLTRVSAPLFVAPETGTNDDLNGIERAVGFDVKGIGGKEVQIVHSLAKWKRMALYRYGFEEATGLYTDMNAIRRDEELTNLHSIYVDQWDWEKIIKKEDRTEEKLKEIVSGIYRVFKATEDFVGEEVYDDYEKFLPEEIFFVTAQELEDMYPEFTSKERETAICKKHKAVFIMKIGGDLKSGEKHDGRAPDYDDWELNGDIVFWNPILESAFELSSMGIRVDEESLERQLTISGCEDKKELQYHRMLLDKELPYTVGGGIGQSRICMFFLRKAHIGEVQASIWPVEMMLACERANIQLL